MTIREAINILIDAPDKEKPFIVECRKDTFSETDGLWGQAEVERIFNCSYASVVEVKEPSCGSEVAE